jgi:hypothetical protein
MEGREAICECEKYQGTNIGGKGEWYGSIEGKSGGGDWFRKKRWNYEKKSDT